MTVEDGAMISAIFDSLGYFEKLKAAGVPEEQAAGWGSDFTPYLSLRVPILFTSRKMSYE